MEVKSSTTSPIKLKCPRGPSNTKWVSYRLVAQKNRKLFGNKSTEAWKIKLDVPSVKYNFGSKSRELDLKILGGVGASLRRGRECQGRTIFWLTSLELEVPRGITAPDLSALTYPANPPWVKCNWQLINFSPQWGCTLGWLVLMLSHNVNISWKEDFSQLGLTLSLHWVLLTVRLHTGLVGVGVGVGVV